MELKDKSRLLNVIVSGLTEEYSIIYSQALINKTGWNSFSYKGGKIQKIEESIDYIKNCIEKYNLKSSNEKYDQNKRGRITYNLEKHSISGNIENALERIITILNDKEDCVIKNQIVTLDQGHIDFVVNYNGKTSFVELKKWKNKVDNPIYAIIESLKNYYLYKHLVKKNEKYHKVFVQYVNEHNIQTIDKLIILAPQEYYVTFCKGKNGDMTTTWSSFFNYVEELNTILKKDGVEIQLKYLDISKKEWDDTFKNFDKSDLKTEKRKIKGKERIYYRIELKEHKNKFEKIRKRCQYPWKNITKNNINNIIEK